MIRRLLVPLDGSALAERALAYATYLASVLGARLTLLPCEALLATSKVPDFDVNAFPQSQGEAVGALSRPRRMEIEAVAHAVYLDKLDKGVCDAARDRKSNLGRPPMSSVATRMLQRANTPICLVRPDALSATSAESRGSGAAGKE